MLLGEKAVIDEELRDYILIKKLYHCSPFSLEQVPKYVLQLHWELLQLEGQIDVIQRKKNEQNLKVKKLLNE